jgi:PAS domain S-box-containing protein
MDSKALQILVVEDEPAHAEAIRRAFKTARPGDTLLVAQSLQDYLTAVAQNTPDIVITDMKLPDGSALSVLSSPAEFATYPVVVMTSYGNEEVAVEAMKAGALDYVVKSPETFTDMPRTVDRIMREWKLLQQQKAAANELRNSEEAIRALLNATEDAACILDLEGKFIALNETAARRFGKKIHELEGTNILNNFSREFLSDVKDRLLAVFKSQEPRQYEYELKGRQYHESLYPIFDESGVSTRIAIYSRDITDKRRAEQELKGSLEQLRTYFNLPIIGIATTSKEKGWIDMNPKFCSMLGYTQEELRTKKMADITPAEDMPQLEKIFFEILCGKHSLPYSFEKRYVRKDGSIITAELATDRIRGSDGEPDHFVSFVQDITARKEAAVALQKSEEANRALLNATEDAACILDLEFRFVSLNEQMAKMVGKTVGELTGTSILQRFSPEEAARRRARMLALVQSGLPNQYEEEFNGLFYVDSLYPVIDETGAVTRIAIYSRNITEQRMAEKNLQASLNQLRAYFYLPLIGIATTNRWKGWIAVNPKLCQMLGYTEAELRAKSWAEVTPAADIERDSDLHTRIQSGVLPLPHTFEKRFLKKDGTIITTEISTDTIGDPDNATFAAFIRDITESKQAEAALQRSMDELSAIYDSTQVMLCVIDAERRVIQANRAFVEFTVWPTSAIAHERVCGVFGCINAFDDQRGCGFGPQCKICEIYTAIADTLSTGRMHTNIEYRTTVLRSGRREDVSLLCSTVMIASGEETRLLLSFLDITERKLVEEALLQSEENYRQLFDAESDAIFLIDNITGQIVQANKAATSLYGYGHEKLLEMKSADLLAQPEEGACIEQAIMKASDQIIKVPARRHRRKNGDEFFVEITARGFLQNGRGVHIAAVRDITERTQAEEELGRYRNNLEELVRLRTEELALAKQTAESANRAKSMFLANMSHEFRSPMNAIIGFSEILEKLAQDDRQRQYVHRIRESGSALMMLLNDILDFSKIEAGKMHLYQEPVSVRPLLEDVCQLFSRKIEEKNIAFCLEIEQAVPGLIFSDSVRLRQILLNLIGNAVKFTAVGEVRVLLDIPGVQKDEADGPYMRITVQDTGIGIPGNELDSIFEPFEQQKGDVMKGYGGTGLGLSITRSLVESMGGLIRVESQVGKGSIFTVELPFVEAEQDPLEQTRHPVKGEFDDVKFRQALVLVVDDISYNREIIRGFYDGFDIEIEEAENGQVALEKARQRKPDLILLDMKMPVMDGYDCIKALKSETALRDIPVIAVTAQALKEEELRIRALCHGYICKPFHREVLIRETMQYVPYTLKSPAADAHAGAEIGEAELEGMVAGLPDELARALKAAAGTADVGKIRELIGKVKKIDARFGELLAGYAGCYNYDGIVEVLNIYKV